MNNGFRILLALGVALATTTAFAWTKREGVQKVEAKGVVSIGADWVKDKGNKFDVSLKFMNESKNTILMYVGDMHCGRGEDSGHVLADRSRIRVIDVRPEEQRSEVMICKLGEDRKGDFWFSVKVYDNPTNDSSTTGKVVVEKLTWKQGATVGKEL